MNSHNLIQIKNRLDNSHREDNGKLKRILTAYLKIQGKQKKFQESQSFFWSAVHFKLHQSSLFKQAEEKKQHLILEKCSMNLIQESYFVEKSASAYCAKMMLTAKTTEIAQTYSMIANEEAIHLEWITPYMPIADRHVPKGHFLRFLSNLIEECDPALLPYLVQVILEGWGLHHYKELASDCLNENLKSIFLDIVRDEALHHHTGEVVFDGQNLTEKQLQYIEECLKAYAEMVRVGPLDLMEAVEEVLGPLSSLEKQQFLKEIEADQATLKKLALLKQLMIQPGLEATVQKLEDQGFFTLSNTGLR
jgi:hypothetical protein